MMVYYESMPIMWVVASLWVPTRLVKQPFSSPRLVVCGSRARDCNQSSGNNTGGHGDRSCAVGALGGRPAGKMAAVATAGGSHKTYHEGMAIRHFPRLPTY